MDGIVPLVPARMYLSQHRAATTEHHGEFLFLLIAVPTFSVVGSMRPLALVGCGSIFMGEIAIFMNRAGRLRLGVQASEKDEDLGVPSSGAMIAAGGA